MAEKPELEGLLREAQNPSGTETLRSVEHDGACFVAIQAHGGRHGGQSAKIITSSPGSAYYASRDVS